MQWASHTTCTQGRKSHSPSRCEKPTELRHVESGSKGHSQLLGPPVWLVLFQNVFTAHLQKKCDAVRSRQKSSLKNHCTPFKPQTSRAQLAGETQNQEKLHQNLRELEAAGGNPGEQSGSMVFRADTQQYVLGAGLEDGSWALQRIKQQHRSVVQRPSTSHARAPCKAPFLPGTTALFSR